MIDVKQNEDGSFTIEWDSEDPYESIFNDWTEEDFTNAILEYAEEVIANSENAAEFGEESSETVSTNEAEEADTEEHNSGDDSISEG